MDVVVPLNFKPGLSDTDEAGAQLGQGLTSPLDRRHRNQTESYWLGMLDIDHFKQVNDSFGHLIGDEVLLLVARLLRLGFRSHDRLYRFLGKSSCC